MVNVIIYNVQQILGNVKEFYVFIERWKAAEKLREHNSKKKNDIKPNLSCLCQRQSTYS